MKREVQQQKDRNEWFEWSKKEELCKIGRMWEPRVLKVCGLN
jgi:hypothetical protein